MCASSLVDVCVVKEEGGEVLPYSCLCVCLSFVCIHRWQGTHCHAPSALPLSWKCAYMSRCTCGVVSL